MDNENKSGWYAPLERENKSAAQNAEREKKKRGLPAPWRAALGILLAMGLIAGSSLFFADKDEAPVVIEKPYDLPAPEIGMPDDWEDFFGSFFVPESGSQSESEIPAVKERPDWELRLEKPGTSVRSLEEIYRDCVDSIVGIRAYTGGQGAYHWGSGIVMSEDGLILTNAHMVAGCTSAEVILRDNSSCEAELVGEDRVSDLAVLKIDAKGLKPAVFGDSDELRVGENVAAIGNPLGEEFTASLTNGIVSGVDRGIDFDGHSIRMIQTNAAINEGSSGGALVNMYGQVVGVTNMKMVSYYSSIEGICFAIPSSTAQSVVNALIRNGRVTGRPGVGITVGAIPKDAADYYELPYGLYVAAVSKGSDAEAKGILEGDIITAVNGEPARSSDDILRVRNSLGVGDTIRFTIWRDGKSFDKDVALVEYTDVY